MYTVKELIEALEKCPGDYIVKSTIELSYHSGKIKSVAIDNDKKTVDLFVDM